MCFSVFALIFQIKALISAPPTESSPMESKKFPEEPAVTTVPAAEPPAVDPKPKPAPKVDPAKTAKALGLLGKRTFDKYILTVHVSFLSATTVTQ